MFHMDMLPAIASVMGLFITAFFIACLFIPKAAQWLGTRLVAHGKALHKAKNAYRRKYATVMINSASEDELDKTLKYGKMLDGTDVTRHDTGTLNSAIYAPGVKRPAVLKTEDIR